MSSTQFRKQATVAMVILSRYTKVLHTGAQILVCDQITFQETSDFIISALQCVHNECKGRVSA